MASGVCWDPKTTGDGNGGELVVCQRKDVVREWEAAVSRRAAAAAVPPPPPPIAPFLFSPYIRGLCRAAAAAACR